MIEQTVLIVDDRTGAHRTMALHAAIQAAAIHDLGPHDVIVVGDSVNANRQALLEAITGKRREARELSDMFPFTMPYHPRGHRALSPFVPRPRPPKKATTCTLPGCEETTTHNGGYCCAAHCKAHRLKTRRAKS